MKAGRKKEGIDIVLSDSDVSAFIKCIKKNGRLTVAGVGIFEIVNIKARTLYHNTAKRELTTKAYNKLKYTPSKNIKFLINS